MRFIKQYNKTVYQMQNLTKQLVKQLCLHVKCILLSVCKIRGRARATLRWDDMMKILSEKGQHRRVK